MICLMIRTAHLLSFRLVLVLGFALLIFVLPHRPASAQPSGIDGREPIPILRILERDPGDVYHVPETLPGIQNVPFPRAFAMGDAGVALRTPAAIRLNPAAIGQEQSVVASFNLGTEPWLSVGAPLVDGWITTASLSIQPNPRWALGGHFTKQSFGKIDITNEAGVLLRSDEKSQMKAGVSGAYHVTDSWSLGAGLAIVRESFGEASAASLALDLGVRGGWMVDAGAVSLEPSVGWSLVNVGSPLDLGRRRFFTFSDGRKPLPMTMRLGSAVRLASERTWTQHPVLAVTVQAELSKVLAGGEYVPDPQDPEEFAANAKTYGTWEALTKTWGAAFAREGTDQRVGAWEQIGRHVGAEVTAYGIASLRLGRRGGSETYTSRRYTTFGLGLDLVYVQFDYARILGESVTQRVTGAIPAGYDRSIRYDGTSYFRVTVPFPLNGEYDGNWW